MIDQTTTQGKALQAVVKEELRKYLGKDYNDDVLPLYIVVMLAHGNQRPLVAENLDAFLGPDKAAAFAEWLFQHLEANPGKYEAPAAEEEAKGAEPAADQPDREEEGGRKRRREKRDKIEWKGEPPKASRHERREEKRRRSSEKEERRRSSEKEERARDREDRDHDRDRRRVDEGRHEPSRHDREAREGDRWGERGRHRERPPALDEVLDRRESRRARQPEARAKTPGSGGRLAGRLGGSEAPEQLDRREPERPSVFDRLARAPRASEDAKGRLRMDALPRPPAEDPSPSPEPEKPAATAGTGSSLEVAAELRQIRETLARMQAEKARAVNSGVASANARRAVLHNVHFSATPDILRAHFSGCGPVVSAVLEKDPAGNPRGTAVIEFEEESQRKTALTLSGSLLLGRPITVYAKESAPAYSPPVFKPRVPAAAFRPRAPAPGRVPGRAPGRGPGRGFGRSGFHPRPQLKNNKYVRPQEAAAGEDKANGTHSEA